MVCEKRKKLIIVNTHDFGDKEFRGAEPYLKGVSVSLGVAAYM